MTLIERRQRKRLLEEASSAKDKMPDEVKSDDKAGIISSSTEGTMQAVQLGISSHCSPQRMRLPSFENSDPTGNENKYHNATDKAISRLLLPKVYNRVNPIESLIEGVYDAPFVSIKAR